MAAVSTQPAAQGDRVADQSRRRPRLLAAPGLIALNMTPMIDVVFQLLIFFMVATDFRIGEEIYRMDLPQRGTAASADPFSLDEEPLRITIASGGADALSYSLQIDGPYPQPATFDDLHEFLRSHQIRATEPGGLFSHDHPIIIQPARTARWEHAVEAFNAAARARYANITLAQPR